MLPQLKPGLNIVSYKNVIGICCTSFPLTSDHLKLAAINSRTEFLQQKNFNQFNVSLIKYLKLNSFTQHHQQQYLNCCFLFQLSHYSCCYFYLLLLLPPNQMNDADECKKQNRHIKINTKKEKLTLFICKAAPLSNRRTFCLNQVFYHDFYFGQRPKK